MIGLIWILSVFAAVLLIIAFAVFFSQRKEKKSTDYYSIFLIGCMWLAMGFPLKNAPVLIIGALFVLTGLINKNKWHPSQQQWGDLDRQERMLKVAVVIFVCFVVMIGISAYILNRP